MEVPATKTDKDVWENRVCVRDSRPLKRRGEQTQFNRMEGWHKQRNDTRNPCAGADVSGQRMGIRRTQGVRGLGWWGRVVAGVVKRCSDGALDVRNMSGVWSFFFESPCIFPSECLSFMLSWLIRTCRCDELANEVGPVWLLRLRQDVRTQLYI